MSHIRFRSSLLVLSVVLALGSAPWPVLAQDAAGAPPMPMMPGDAAAPDLPMPDDQAPADDAAASDAPDVAPPVAAEAPPLPEIPGESKSGASDKSSGKDSTLSEDDQLDKALEMPAPMPPGAAANIPGLSLPIDEKLLESERTPEEEQAEIRREAFDAAVMGLMPMTPDEIRKLLKKYDETQEAVEKPIYPYPDPEVTLKTISLDPGQTPPTIKMAVGHVTTIAIVDVTGEPWPVQDLSWAGNFEVVSPGEGGHVLRITPMSEFAYGNLSMRLIGLKTPVTFTLRTHRDVVQYRLDIRVPEYGPNAAPPLMEGGISVAAGDATIAAILDGAPPAEAEKLSVSGVDGRTSAYALNGMTYVRTPLTLLSPAWSGSVASADGMKVYALNDAPVLLLSDRGRLVRAHLSREDIADE